MASMLFGDSMFVLLIGSFWVLLLCITKCLFSYLFSGSKSTLSANRVITVLYFQFPLPSVSFLTLWHSYTVNHFDVLCTLFCDLVHCLYSCSCGACTRHCQTMIELPGTVLQVSPSSLGREFFLVLCETPTPSSLTWVLTR